MDSTVSRLNRTVLEVASLTGTIKHIATVEPKRPKAIRQDFPGSYLLFEFQDIRSNVIWAQANPAKGGA